MNFLWSCALALVSVLALGQTYKVKTLNVQDGLMGEQVYDVVQDDKGLLWISTNNGICNYDGLTFTEFSDTLLPTQFSTRLHKLAENRIMAVGVDDNGVFGASVFNGVSWAQLTLPPRLKGPERKLWTKHRQGEREFLVILQKDSLFQFDVQTSTYAITALNSRMGRIFNRIVSHNETLYLLSSEGLFIESGDDWKQVSNPSHPNVIGIQFGPDGVGYVSGTDWIGILRGDQIEKLPFQLKNDKTRINQLTYNQHGFLFFRSDKSFYWYHLETGQSLSFKTDNNDVNPFQSRMYFDLENNLWITSTRGLHRIQSFRFSFFRKEDGLLENEVTAIGEISKGKYFLGSQKSYSIIDQNAITAKAIDAPGISRISSVIQWNGDLWFSAQSMGIGRLTPNNRIEWMLATTSSIELVAALKGKMWVHDARGNLSFRENGQLILMSSPMFYIRNLYEISDGRLVACTTDGLKWHDGNRWNRVIRPRNPRLFQSICLAEIDGRKLVGTQAGLAEWKGDSLQLTTFREHRIVNAVYSILPISDQEIWFGTDDGVILFRNDQLHHYGPTKGLSGYDVNRSALILGSSGEVLIGTNGGLNVYNHKLDWPRSQIFKPEVLSITTRDRTDNLVNEPVNFTHETARGGIQFNVRAITFSDEDVKFRYRLVGFDNDWQTLTSVDQRSIVYRNLPEGDFEFEVQSSLGNGPWSASVKTSSITISAPFYRAWWFYAVVLALALAVGYGINTTLSQYSRNKRLQAMVDEKITEIRENEDKLRIALDNSKMGAWTYYFPNDRLTLTPRVYEILDLEHTNDPRLDIILDAIHADDRIALDAKIQSSLKDLEAIDVEARLKNPSNSTRWIHIKGKAINNGEGKAHMISGTLNEITRRKKLEADRERMIAELERTNRELDRFVYSASHDLSAPLKSVLGLINISKMSGTREETHTYLNMMERSVNKLDAFIKDIISYSRNSRLEVVEDEVDLVELVNDVLENFRFDEQFKTTEVSSSISPEATQLTTDKQRMKIILNNLISNALKFRKRISDVPHQVTVRAFIKDGSRIIEVTDNGEGIAESHQKKVFDMFYRANDHVWGSGLGLYIARETAERIGFRLEVDSALGVGSTFRLVEKEG